MDPKISELKKRISELESELAELRKWHDVILSEDCPKDEKHCGCVPILRKEIAALRKRIEDAPEIEFRFGRSGTEYVLKSGTAKVYTTYKLVEVKE